MPKATAAERWITEIIQ